MGALDSFLPPLILELKGETGHLAADLVKTKGEIGKFAAETDAQTARVQRALHTTRLVGKAAFLGLGAAAIAGGAAAVHMAGDFQQSQERLVTSAGESQKNLGMVSSGLEQMAGQLGYTTQQLSQGMYTVESAGFHAGSGLTVMKAAAQGAKAENADLGTVSNALTDILKDYHLKASDAAKVTSQMITATSLGKTTFEQFSGAFGNIMPLAAAAHLSFGEMAADLSQFTLHGISADQASQNMANAIRALQAPTLAQTKAMAGYGVNAQDVAQKLSKRGLAGTMQYLSETILHRMGPSGMVLQNVMNTSKAAAQDADLMYKKLAPTLQSLAQGYERGTITQKDWRKELKAQTPDNANLLRQWATMERRSHGFAQALKSGSPAAKTYAAALQSVTGTSAGLNVALMLTGENTKSVQSAIQKVSSATTDAQGNVKGWSEIQSTFNQQLSQTWGAVSALGVRLGTDLLPWVEKGLHDVSAFTGVLERHKTAAEVLGVVIGGGLAAAMGVYVASVVWAAGRSAVSMATDIAHGAAWVAAKFVQSEEAAGYAEAGALQEAAAWLESNAAVLASSIAGAAGTAAAWIAANAAMIIATGGILLAVGLLVAGGIYLAHHWRQVWGDITRWTDEAWHWLDGILNSKIGEAILGLIAPELLLVRHWRTAWNDIKTILNDAWRFMQPIIHTIEGALSGMSAGVSAISSVGSGLAGFAHSLHIPGFDVGGEVPGPVGAPMLAVVHGGEYVLSHNMRTGRQSSSGAYDGGGGGGGATHNTTVNVYAQTNADPEEIGREVGWQMRLNK